MKREDIIRLGHEAFLPHEYETGLPMYIPQLERFANRVIQEHCERMARAIEAMPFGATSDSFAVFVREFK